MATPSIRQNLIQHANYECTTVFRDDCTPLELIGSISMRLAGARSMSIAICGEGFETFNRWDDQIRDAYIFELHTRIEEIQTAFRRLTDIACFQRKAAVVGTE
jgi:hypothetical protein